MMRDTYSNRSLYCAFVGISIMVLMLMPDFSGKGLFDTESTIKVTLYTIFLLAFQLFSFKFLLPSNSTLIVVFLVLSYLFNLSQIVLNAFDYELSDSLLSLSVLKSNYSGDAINVALKSIVGIYLSIITYYTFRRPESKCIAYSYNTTAFICISFIIGLVCDVFNNVIAVLTFGYANTESTPLLFISRIFSLLLISSVIMYIMSDRYTKRSKRVLAIVFITYKLICMLTGYRAYALISIFLFLYVYFRCSAGFNIKKKHIFLGLLCTQVLSSVLVSVREMRQTSVDATIVIDNIFSFNNTIILDILAEFGITLNVISTVVGEMNGVGTGGDQVLSSFLSVIPGARLLFPNMDLSKMNMDEYLGIHGIGGSYIGDLVFDFGTEYITLVSIIFGLVYTYLFDKFELSLKKGNYMFAVFWAPLIVEMIFSIRSSTYKLPRLIIWYAIIFLTIRIISGCLKPINRRINGQ